MRFIVLAVLSIILVSCVAQQAAQDSARDCNQHGYNGMTCVKNHPKFASLSPVAKRQVLYGAMLEEEKRKGQISESQADFMFGEYSSKLAAEENGSNSGNNQIANDALIATGASMMAGNRPMQPYPNNTSCSSFMGTINCRNY